MMSRTLVLSIICVGLLLTLAVFFHGLVDFELPGTAQQRTLGFFHDGARLEGTLVLPEAVEHPPVVALVHGDGAQDRWSQGGYLPLVNALLARGIGVFSWDKPGVGASSGSWLDQRMDDRAGEAVAALEALRQVLGRQSGALGLLGFSQAGWVVPEASQRAGADFAVLVGPAINWRDQGRYYLRQRLQGEGQTGPGLEQWLIESDQAFSRNYTLQSVARPCAGQCDRKDFERRNALVDARQAIRAMTVPVMVLMGERDRNVDPQDTLSTWRALLPSDTQACIGLVKEGTHGLLRANLFDYQLAEQWPLWVKGVFLGWGRGAYAPQALDEIAGWVLARHCEQP